VSETMLMAWDIETCTNPGDGLDPTNPLTRITSIAVYFGPLNPESEEPEGAVAFDDPREDRLIRCFRDFMQDPSTPASILADWNGANFDVPFLVTRAAMHEIPLFKFNAVGVPERKGSYGPCKGHKSGYALQWGKHDHADIWPSYREYAKQMDLRGPTGKPTSGLKPVAKSFGIEMTEVDREKMELLSVSERASYNISDVFGTFRLAQQLEMLKDDGIVEEDISYYLDSKLF
jgi:DNA polymerase elongation subunit (family B)